MRNPLGPGPYILALFLPPVHPDSVTGSLSRRVAQLAWLLPLFFGGIALHQGWVVYDLERTKTQGVEATAEVQEVHVETRSDVTYDYVSLRIPMPDGSVLTRGRLSLPHGIVPALKGKDELAVRVVPERGALVVTERLGETPVVDTQIRIAGINGLMGLGAALLFGLGVFYWNRSLRREGDPAERGVTEPDPEHPAARVVRS